MSLESRESPAFFSQDTARVWWPPTLSCVLWSFLASREAPDEYIRSPRKADLRLAGSRGLVWLPNLTLSGKTGREQPDFSHDSLPRTSEIGS